MREIPEEEYTRWSQIYDKASTTLVNRAEELDKAAEMIEQNLFLLGATAIEDKLQDGVPDTIYSLQEAGIKVWVLTGDRQETAINIGYSCKLLNEEMSLIICNEDNHWDTKNFLEKKLKEINDVLNRGDELEVKKKKKRKTGPRGSSVLFFYTYSPAASGIDHRWSRADLCARKRH